MHTLKMGIPARGSAGRNSLTERLLRAAGVADTPGRRLGAAEGGAAEGGAAEGGAAVVSFTMGGVTVNLVDPPDRPVLDAAVLVVPAVGDAPARVLMCLERLRVPALPLAGRDRLAHARTAQIPPWGTWGTPSGRRNRGSRPWGPGPVRPPTAPARGSDWGPNSGRCRCRASRRLRTS